MMDRTTRAMALAIALVGASAASANAQQSSTGAVARNQEVKDTTHRTEPVTPAPDSEKNVIATTSVPAGRGHGLMRRATAAAASAAKTVKSAGEKEGAAEAAMLVVGKANPGALMVEEVLRAQQRNQQQAAAAQATRQANADAAMATATAQMSAGMAAMAQQLASTAPSVAGSTGSPSDPDVAAVRAVYLQLAPRAASGDRKAADQLARFQREMSAGASAANALACATNGKGCRTR